MRLASSWLLFGNQDLRVLAFVRSVPPDSSYRLMRSLSLSRSLCSGVRTAGTSCDRAPAVGRNRSPSAAVGLRLRERFRFRFDRKPRAIRKSSADSERDALGFTALTSCGGNP